MRLRSLDRGGQELHRAAGEEGVAGRLAQPPASRQPGAPVEQCAVAVRLLPGQAVLLQPLAQQVSGAVLVDPVAQPGPGVQQRLVGDLHGVRVERHQPGPHQAPPATSSVLSGSTDSSASRRRVLRLRVACGVLAQPDQPEQQQRAAVRAAGSRPDQAPFGGRGHRALDARRPRGDRPGPSAPAFAPLPGREQGVRRAAARPRQGEWAPRGLSVLTLADDQLGESWFELHADGPGGRGHRLAQFRGGQRPQHHVPVLQRVGQLGVPQAPVVEVGAYAQGHQHRWRAAVGAGRAGGLSSRMNTRRSRLVGAEGEEFLELVHDDDRTGTGGGAAWGVGGCTGSAWGSLVRAG